MRRPRANSRPRNSAPSHVQPIDVSRLKTYPLSRRHSKVRISDFATPWTGGGSLRHFLEGLPNILAAQTLRTVTEAMVLAHRRGRHIVLGMGAHPIKVGLSPVVIDLMERGVITAVAMNGAGIIHDFEIALLGQTSEDVEAEIDSGRFGMADETGGILNAAIARGHQEGWGIGEAVGRYLHDHRRSLPHTRLSILATGARLNIPVTVHVAIGTDIIHMHPSADGAAIGAGSLFDFRKLATIVSRMEGGVYVNLGSAVIMPEVFLKTVTLGRNLGRALKRITTVNMDFLPHYRPSTNVVKRPTQKGGRGYTLIGHHELMFPLLAASIREQLPVRSARTR